MRFPKITELDKDQTTIFQGAPPDEPILIVGPPGTGKTVVAFHRASYLQTMKKNPTVLMFNKVLSRFASKRGKVAEEVPVKTVHSWAHGWWNRMGKTRRQNPPNLDGQGWVHDWERIGTRAVEIAHPSDGERVNWGHLILDEGQDFPPAMFRSFALIMSVVGLQTAVKPRPSITVLADDNQRLNEGHNSKVEDIRSGLKLSPDRVYKLTKNYRNSRQIAEFAASFFVGHLSGKPDLPDRNGPSKPIVLKSSEPREGPFWDQCATRIARHASTFSTEEIGVLIPNNSKMLTSFYNRLERKLKDASVSVQAYLSGNEDHPAEDLQFDAPGHVTLLNFASAKGLEFDTVFILDPGRMLGVASSEQSTKMALYVGCSRARHKLYVLVPESEKTTQLLSWVKQDRYAMESM